MLEKIYPTTYAACREKFIVNAKQHGLMCTSIELAGQQGPNGEALFIDIATYGSHKASKLLLCISGTHGGEGFAGSHVQSAFIERKLAQYKNKNDTHICFVHGLNPYGFAWGLRNNENNVDLNRNWIDHSTQTPSNEDFRLLAPLLKEHTQNIEALQVLKQKLLEKADEKSIFWLENALSMGQFEYPTLMSFGGNSLQFSCCILQSLIRENYANIKNVAYVDLHSGTPGYGEHMFLCFSDPQSREFQHASAWWGEENLAQKAVETAWGGKRPERHGLLYHGVTKCFSPEAMVAGAVVEFGTVESNKREDALLSIVLEQMVRHNARLDSEASTQLRSKIRRAFDHSDDPIWVERVITNGIDVLEKAINGLDKT